MNSRHQNRDYTFIWKYVIMVCHKFYVSSGSSCERFYKFEVAERFFRFTGGLSGPLTLFFYNEYIFFFSLNVLCKDENVGVVVSIKNALFSVYYLGGSFCSVLRDPS